MSRPKYTLTVLDSYLAPAHSVFSSVSPEKVQKLYCSQTPYKVVSGMTVAPDGTIQSQLTIFNEPTAC
jgi:hypothetical protein